MADRERLLKALRNASTAADAGNEQAAADAKRLANTLKQMDSQPQQQAPERGGFDRFARGFGGGLADLAGIPIGAGMEAASLMGADIENTSGSDWLKSKLEPLGLTGAPGEDLGMSGAIGEGVSQFGLPGAAGSLALARRGAGMVGGAARTPAATAGGRMLDDASMAAARAPAATAGAEVTAAAGEAAGRRGGENAFGEGSWETEMSGLVGGIVGGMSPAGVAAGGSKVVNAAADNLPLAGLVRNATRRLFKMEPGKTQRKRASDRLRAVAEQPGDDSGLMPARQSMDDTGEVFPDMLTPAQQTNDPGVMSLAARERANDPAVLADWRSQFERNMNSLKQELKDVDAADVSRIEAELGQNVDDVAAVAAGRAQERLAKMTPNQRRAEASTVLRNELDSAYRVARTQESDLWESVPEDMVMPAEVVRQRYLNMRGQLAEENIEDMPQKAAQFLDPDSPQSYFRPDADGDTMADTIPLKRLQRLRSALLNEARNASSGSSPNRNRARIARELADGLLDDMASVDPRESPGTAAFNAARTYSRQLNDRFTRGVVGDVLQTKARGDASIAPEATLDRTLGRGGVEAERAASAFVKAFKNPSETVRGAFNDYLQDDFRKMAMRDDQLNPAGAEKFMQKYRELFQARPVLREQFDTAIQSGNLASVAGDVRDGAARVLGKGNPAKEIRRIKQQTESDPTGAVWTSFRRGLTQELFERARVRNPQGDIDTEILSGSMLNELLDSEKIGPALRQAYNKTELANLRKIANTAQRMERDVGSRAAADLITDEPNALATLLAGYSGAIAGSAATRATGGNSAASFRTANLFSGAFQRMVRRGFRDPASHMIERALHDKEFMKLLLAPNTGPDYQTRVVPRINAWVAGMVEDAENESDGVQQ